MAGDLLTLVMTSSCAGRRAQGAGHRASDTAACEGWVRRGVDLVHCVLPRSFSITASCLPGKLYRKSPNRYDEITGSCCVARPDRQPNSPGKRQNGWRPHSSTTVFYCVWWEKQLRHEGEGSIKSHQIFICHTALSPWLYPHRIVQQTTKKTAPENNNNTRKSLQCRAKKQL